MCDRLVCAGQAVCVLEGTTLLERLVLAWLASSVDLSLAPALASYLERYSVHPVPSVPLQQAGNAMRARLAPMRRWRALAQKRWHSR